LGFKAIRPAQCGRHFGYLGTFSGGGSVLCFRGTANVWEWIGDAEAELEIRAPWRGRVHHGFASAAEDFLPWVQQALPPSGPLWVTGHSLGAAIATLVATELDAQGYVGVQPLYTFGGPRVGNAEFFDAFWLKCFRVVHGDDQVPHLPPAIEYMHVGHEIFVDDGGVMERAPTIFGDMCRLFRHAKRGLPALLSECWADHHIDKYVNALEQALDSQNVARAAAA
jgi:hypothetical protein